MTKQLEVDDFEVLLEALVAWEKKDDFSAMLGELVPAMFAKDDPEAKRKMDIEREDRHREHEAKTRHRRERSVLLQAKLIEMRDSLAIESFTDGLKAAR